MDVLAGGVGQERPWRLPSYEKKAPPVAGRRSMQPIEAWLPQWVLRDLFTAQSAHA
jgi:hypothetical protein